MWSSLFILVYILIFSQLSFSYQLKEDSQIVCFLRNKLLGNEVAGSDLSKSDLSRSDLSKNELSKNGHQYEWIRFAWKGKKTVEKIQIRIPDELRKRYPKLRLDPILGHVTLSEPSYLDCRSRYFLPCINLSAYNDYFYISMEIPGNNFETFQTDAEIGFDHSPDQSADPSPDQSLDPSVASPSETFELTLICNKTK